MDNNKKYKSFYFITAIVGMVLFVSQIGIYRKTIIPFKIPFTLTFIFAVLTFFIIHKKYRQTYQNKNIFFPFAQSYVSFGFIACYIFIALNFYLADNNFEVKSFPILRKHTIGAKHPQPAIEIDYEGLEKQLVFYTVQQKQVDSSTQISLTVKKGFFGYDIFSNIELK